MSEIARITEAEVSLIKDKILDIEQIRFLLKKTPKRFIKQRPAKGGGQWDYVSGGFVRKTLNLMFGFDWSFNIIDKQYYADAKQVVVQGRLTCNVGDRQIIKEQFGSKDVVLRKIDQMPLNLGNDFKAAATDALKKCAADIGIAADVYNKEEFKEVDIVSSDDMLQEIITLSAEKLIPSDMVAYITRVIDNEETASYTKVYNYLTKLS